MIKRRRIWHRPGGLWAGRPGSAQTNVFILKSGTKPVINRELLEGRKRVSDSRPEFRRQESWRYDRLKEAWRKPKGKDNHQRKQKSRGRPGIVKVGYGGPRASRGLHPSGYTDNLVFNLSDLDGLDPKTDGVRLGHGVGSRKRRDIAAAAAELKFKIFNARVAG